MQSKATVEDSKIPSFHRLIPQKLSLTLLSCLVLNRLRAQFNERGATTVRSLGRTFRAIDSYDGNRKVDPQEFFVGLQENGVKITKAEVDVRK